LWLDIAVRAEHAGLGKTPELQDSLTSRDGALRLFCIRSKLFVAGNASTANAIPANEGKALSNARIAMSPLVIGVLFCRRHGAGGCSTTSEPTDLLAVASL